MMQCFQAVSIFGMGAAHAGNSGAWNAPPLLPAISRGPRVS